MSLGNTNIHQKGEIPEIVKLPNDRIRVIRRFQKFTREDIDNANLGSLMGDFGDLDTVGEQFDNQGYSNCRLISVEVDNRFNSVTNTENPVLTKTYETITNSFVKINNDKISNLSSGLRVLTRESIATEGTEYTGIVGSTYVSHFISNEPVSADGFKFEPPSSSTAFLFSGFYERTLFTETAVEYTNTLDSTKKFVWNPSVYDNEWRLLQVEGDLAGESFYVEDGRTLHPWLVEWNISEAGDEAGIVDYKISAKDFRQSNSFSAFNGAGLFLSDFQIDDTNGYRKVTEKFVEFGTIRTSTSAGRIDDTKEVTVVSIGAKETPDGAVISSSEENQNGLTTFTVTAIQGCTSNGITGITGVKQTYKDVVEVQTAGTVELTTVTIPAGSSGGSSNTVAIPKVTPVRTKQIAANVSIEVTTTPPSTADLAFDLSNVSCSVTSISTSLKIGAGATVTATDGSTSTTRTGEQKSFSSSARIQTFPSHYLTGTNPSSGSVSYTYYPRPVVNNNVITDGDAVTSTSTTKCIGTGSSSSTGYDEVGIIKRKSRPIITALDGTTYYEVITWSVGSQALDP